MLRDRLAAEPGNGLAWQQLAVLLAGSARPAEAAEAFARAVAAGVPAQAVAVPQALALSAVGQHEAAIEVIRPVQAKKPKDFALANLLGVLLKRAGRMDEALPVLETARKLDPRSLSPWQNIGNTQMLRGDFAAAIAAFQGALRIDPRNAELWRLLGNAQRAAGDVAAACLSLEKAFAFDPRDRDAAAVLANLLMAQKQPERALAVIARARQARPGDPLPTVLQARVELQLGRIEAALALLNEVIATHPGDANANMLIARIAGDGDRRAANVALRRAVDANPGAWEPAEALVDSLGRSRYDDEAAHLEDAYALAKELLARHPDRMPRLARALRTVFQRVFDIERFEATGALSTLLPHWLAEGRNSAVHYELGQVETLEDRIALVEWHRAWGRQAARDIVPLTPRETAPAPLAAPAFHALRKLRVGFLSSDLRNHPVTYFTLHLLELYDRERFQVFCYSFYEGQRDRVQQLIESRVDAFRWWPKRPDAEVAAGIAADGLDMLFELGGSTAMNKLEVMAYHPARLGASWLGYPHSAGLEAIDYILTDPYIRPEDPRLLIEKPFEMPETWVSLGRLGFAEEPIAEGIPEERRGVLTFGTANNPYKYSRRCVDTWAAVLRAVPGSRFLFIRPEAAGVSFVANAKAAFAARDVDPDRLEFVGIRGKHLPHYNSMDISLDSLPHVGGTTTCEALWMGVPTVTLAGPGFPERLAYSNLSNAGLGDLAAFTLDDYVQKAVALAEDKARRRLLRHGLRQMIRERPLGQADRFVKAFYDKVEEVARA